MENTKAFLIIALFTLTVVASNSTPPNKCTTDAAYDYLVVGGGTAGSTIGTRLAEAGFEVAILEAGPLYEIELPQMEVPVNMVLTWNTAPDLQGVDLNVDWGLVTTPQPGAHDRRIHYAAGKAMGGSSMHNPMIYQRGSKGSYDLWARLLHDESYTWPNILPFFKRGIRFTPPNTHKRFANATTLYNADAFSPNQPPSSIDVSYSNYLNPFSTWAKKGMREIGLPEVEDFNSGTLLGTQFCSSEMNSKTGLRSSSNYHVGGYIASKNEKEEELKITVCTHTLAERILFDSSNTATGVKALYNASIPVKFTARKEIIVSAGSLHSPQLLMVSGIGPASTLEDLDIPVVADSPGVGQNLSDHVFFTLSYPVNMDTVTRFINDEVYKTEQTLQFLSDAGGIAAGQSDLLGWEKIPEKYRSSFPQAVQDELDKFPADWPEAEYITINFFASNFSNPLTQPRTGLNYATIIGVLIASTSRGLVTLNSSSSTMHSSPILNPNWLTTDVDASVSIALFKRAREIWHSPSMRQILTGPEAYPGEEVQTDQQILDAIREGMAPGWHAAGTCRMGSRDDKTAVLDSRARVRGVRRLRVVDASAFPVLPPGHPTSTIYMLAEKIADDIVNGR